MKSIFRSPAIKPSQLKGVIVSATKIVKTAYVIPVAVTLVLIVSLFPCSAALTDTSLESLTGDSIQVAAMERSITKIMQMVDVPGLSIAILNNSKVVYTHAFGVKNKKTGEPLDTSTVFSGGSFSKTVFAWVAMQLVEEGVLDLDRPLYEYLARPLPRYPNYTDLEGDDRYRQITPRMCLSHTTGFPNWRRFTADGRLQFIFEPGERHGYSGEGITLLQMAVKELTGKGLEQLAYERVFEPLRMGRTSFVWQELWAENLARPHDQFSRPKPFNRWREAKAAWSISTTPGDYAKLLVAVLNAQGERRATVDEMLTMQIANRHTAMVGPKFWKESNAYDHVGWGLGWGRFNCEEQGRAIFHTGHDGGVQNYNVTFIDHGIGVVLMSNSDNFESVSRLLLEATIGDTCSPVGWMGYPLFDPNAQREPLDPDPKPIDVDRALLQSYVGTYDVGDGRKLHIELREAGLVQSLNTVDWTPLLAAKPNRFFVEGNDARFSFVVDGTGRVLRLDIFDDGQVVQLNPVEE